MSSYEPGTAMIWVHPQTFRIMATGEVVPANNPSRAGCEWVYVDWRHKRLPGRFIVDHLPPELQQDRR